MLISRLNQGLGILILMMACSLPAWAIEPLGSIQIKQDKMIVSVLSNGCTRVKDFQVLVDGDMITINRMKKDGCRRMPYWLKLTLPVELESDDDRYFIRNPVIPMQ